MAHVEAKMSSKGQLTVPSTVREFLHLEAGDIVDFYVDEENREVRIAARNRNASELFGSLNAYAKEGRRVSIEDMNEAMGRRMAEDDERIKREWQDWQEFQAWRSAKVAQAAK